MSDDKSAAEWQAYYEATAGRPPRPTLLWALERCEPGCTRRRAIDLGCGDGRDTIELLRRGWSVLAIDAEKLALEQAGGAARLPAGPRLTTRCAKFEAVDWPPPIGRRST